tara:strand:- start:329 stop:547 length:219 start_codon:yes stop_codon:yes gene_type:complete
VPLAAFAAAPSSAALPLSGELGSYILVMTGFGAAPAAGGGAGAGAGGGVGVPPKHIIILLVLKLLVLRKLFV